MSKEKKLHPSEEMVALTRESHPKGKPLSADGREVVSSVPMAPPVGFHRQPSLAEQIRNMVRSERLAMEAEAAGYESFEEADDFDVGDDFDPSSPYEENFDPTPISELRRRQKEAESSPPAPPHEQNKEAKDEPKDVDRRPGDRPLSGGRSRPEDPKPGSTSD